MKKCDCPFQITFQITCPCHVLDWLIWLFIAGWLITGMILFMQSKFYFYKDENNQPVKISVIRDLQLWRDYKRFCTMISSLTEKMKETIRLGLRMDYLFMFFAYGLLYLLGRGVAHCFDLKPFWSAVWVYARWLPLLAGVMDILENIFTAWLLRSISKTKAQTQRVTSALKWLLVIINLLALLLSVL